METLVEFDLFTQFSSYIYLGLSLSIGWLVFILVRDSQRRKAAREAEANKRMEEMLRSTAEQAHEQSVPPPPDAIESNSPTPPTLKDPDESGQ